MFANRQQAGLLLAEEVANIVEHNEKFDKHKMIVLGLPRGGVPIGLEIALRLNSPLNVITSKKIGAPQQSELAIGAVTANGTIIIDDYLRNYLEVSEAYLDKETEYLAEKTKSAEEAWRTAAGLSTYLDLKNRQVIIVDDGVATGMTAIAAARSLHTEGVEKLIFATPIISPRAFDLLDQEYDKVVAIRVSENFRSVGEFYADFSQTCEMEVISALTLAKSREKISEIVR